MRCIQQRLWPDAQPLVERLGADFFRTVPQKPGVYLMHGAAEQVLYVGKAKDLKKRLSSYRVANPDRLARRTLRLLNLVERIGWEECETEIAALRREAELLLSLKPRFNRAGVWERPKRFLGWRMVPEGLELAVAEVVLEQWHWAGPFGAQASHIHRALVRLLWCRLHPRAGLASMPAGWFHGGHGGRVVLSSPDTAVAEEACDCLSALAKTGSDRLEKWLLPVTCAFEQQVREEDLELLTQYLAGRGVPTEQA